MPSQIRPNRLEVSDRFPMLGFTIKTDGDRKRYEVAVAADATLFTPEGKANRTRANFYSSRAAGLQPVEHGEAVYVLPPEVLARFVGQEKLYYALATYPSGGAGSPEIASLPSAGSAYISLRSLSGRSLKRVRVLPTRHSATYGNGTGSELEWAGDAATPGTQPVAAQPPAVAAQPAAPDAVGAAALTYNDGFGYLPPPEPPRLPISARAQSNESFSINWDDVQSIAQPTDVSCWATSGAMVVGWRDLISLTPEEIARIARLTTATGLDPAQVGQFAQDLGLVAEAPQSYTVDGFRRMLENYGPLWVGAAVPGLHAIVVTGMYGDGIDTYVRITDPWDRVVGTPGAPGAYLNTHHTGSRYILTWADFVREYEGATQYATVNLQILHATGTAGRQPNRGAAAGYAMAAVARALNTSWSVNWDELELIPQPTEASCWATAAAMVIGWRDRVSLSPERVAEIAGRTTKRGIYPNEHRDFAQEIGLHYETPASYTPDGLRSLLEAYGPLWVGVTFDGSGGHAVVVTGLYSDGAPDNSDTYVRIADPWDREVGTPGAPGPYKNTHNTGSRYIMSWDAFMREYEGRATSAADGTVNVQILHAGGTDGRTPRRSGAAGYAMAAARALEETHVSDADRGIEGPIPAEFDVAMAMSAARGLNVTPEYPQATRFEPAATSNYRASTSARTISRVVIHITDGGANINGTIAWFQNASARVSAHYVVGQDGEVVQMVRHNDVAWHAGRANGDSIGIEHVANTRGLAPTDAEYCASAALTRWLCDTFGIPIDRTHILGHSEADPRTTHTACPNAVWDWAYFMDMVQSGTCYSRSQAQALSSNATAARGDILPPPPPKLMSRAMDAPGAIPGTTLTTASGTTGDATWELDTLNGVKHPHDTPPANMRDFTHAPPIRLDQWPYLEAPNGQRVSLWFNVTWQYNGTSLGNILITPVAGGSAPQRRLHVRATIVNETTVYPTDRPTYAALRIVFEYRFTRPGAPDAIAITDLRLFGDGDYEQTTYWQQQ